MPVERLILTAERTICGIDFSARFGDQGNPVHMDTGAS